MSEKLIPVTEAREIAVKAAEHMAEWEDELQRFLDERLEGGGC